MSDEPTYTYVKGEGWIPLTHSGTITTCKCGTKVLIEYRKVKKGEHFFMGWDESRMVDNVNHVNKYTLNQFMQCDSDNGYYDSSVTVVVPL